MVGDRWGRRKGIMLGSAIMAVGGILQGASVHSKSKAVYRALRPYAEMFRMDSCNVSGRSIFDRIWPRLCQRICPDSDW